MREYQSWEFCRSIDCTMLQYHKSGVTCENCKAYQMHQYLRENGQILEEDSDLAQLAKAQADNAALLEALDLCETISNYKVLPPSFYNNEWPTEVESQYKAMYKQYEVITKDITSHGSALLQELDQLRAVRDAAEDACEKRCHMTHCHTGCPFYRTKQALSQAKEE